MIDKIKVGWKEYRVVETNDAQKLALGNQLCYGNVNYGEFVIHINENISEEQKEATLIHEILHAIDNLWNIDLMEDEVTRLADGIQTVLVQNNLYIAQDSEVSFTSDHQHDITLPEVSPHI